MNHAVSGFNGERTDPLNDTYSLGNGYRACNPRLMRFHCPDSWSPFGAGGINPYVYCAGDPVNRADPSGHHSLGGWLSIGVGVALGLLLTPASGGSSLAMAFSIMSVTAAVASAGLAVAQQFVEASDPQGASVLGWAAMGMGVISGFSSAALSWVAPGASSLVSLLKGTSNRPIGGLMMTESGFPAEVTAPSGGQFRHARFIGVYSDPLMVPEHILTFSYQDSTGDVSCLNIVGMAARKNRGGFALGISTWKQEKYAPGMAGFAKVAGFIHREIAEYPDIGIVRLVIPDAGNTLGSRTGTFGTKVKWYLATKHERYVTVTGPVRSFELAGDAAREMGDLQRSLRINDNHQLITSDGGVFTPEVAQHQLDQISARYGEVRGAFTIVGGTWLSW